MTPLSEPWVLGLIDQEQGNGYGSMARHVDGERNVRRGYGFVRQRQREVHYRQARSRTVVSNSPFHVESWSVDRVDEFRTLTKRREFFASQQTSACSAAS